MTAPRVEKLRQFIQDLDALHREFADERPCSTPWPCAWPRW
jgi:hypothetical protein